MKLNYKVINHPEISFVSRRERLVCHEQNWHYHEEYELISFQESSGIRYIGNSIGQFNKGEIYLIGKNLPHLFRNSVEQSCGYPQSSVDMTIIHFRNDFLGDKFLELPEAKNIKNLLQKSSNGIKFSNGISVLIRDYFSDLLIHTGIFKLTRLLEILELLTSDEHYEIICSHFFNDSYNKNDQERMTKVMKYLSENYHNSQLNLSSASDVACMTPNAFCRFFKNRTHKTFSEYLTEIRIGNACKFLIEGNKQISEISYVTGFNSLSNFNRKFKLIMGVTPSEYMNKYQQDV